MINKTKPRGLPDYEGKHEGPMRYVVRLAQPEHAEAWLLDKFSDGDPEMRLLCHVRGDGTAALRDWSRHCGTTARIRVRCWNCGGVKTPTRERLTG